MADTRIYAVAGAKGGVGKTTTSLNLGASFATRGASVVVVELDLAMANVVDFLDLDVDLGTAPTMHDVLAGDADVRAATVGAPGGIDVVPSGVDLEGFAETDIGRLDTVLESLVGRYERVILDTGAGLSEETVHPLSLADEVILVSTPRVAAVRDAEKTRQLAERVGTDVAGVVFTKSGTGKAPPPPKLAGFLGVELLGHVPEDAAVPGSQDAGRPVVTAAPESPAGTAYRGIAERLATLAAERPLERDERRFATGDRSVVGTGGSDGDDTRPDAIRPNGTDPTADGADASGHRHERPTSEAAAATTRSPDEAAADEERPADEANASDDALGDETNASDDIPGDETNASDEVDTRGGATASDETSPDPASPIDADAAATDAEDATDEASTEDAGEDDDEAAATGESLGARAKALLPWL